MSTSFLWRACYRRKANDWVYPKNVPMRQYQAQIAETSIFQNTLVCLPTGLGKTLIGAVVMYNFYRWFPEGKIVFIAPTKPLVDQQRDACLYKVSIAEYDTMEMTSKQKPETRKSFWEKKRVFFCTPQIVENDIAKGFLDARKLVCLVIDECHRSQGNYASVKVVEHIKRAKVKCRIMGLSATPGRTKQDIQEVVKNLMISRVEFRDEDDEEIQKHTHDRQITKIMVEREPVLDNCQQMVHSILRKTIKPLIKAKLYFNNNVETITRFSLVVASKRNQETARTSQHSGAFQKFFQQAIFLASLLENLATGIRAAHEFLQTSLSTGPLLRSLQHDLEVQQLQSVLRDMVRDNAEHPKIQKLRNILRDHFLDIAKTKRAIVFASYRETVQDIVEMLNTTASEWVSAKKFIGQSGGKNSRGMSQKEQKRILEEFKNNVFNTLVATCIGEEGLDIPEVGLIVCFDGSASPIRDTQRMGRTGRHGAGEVVYLIYDAGKDIQKYDRSIDESKRINSILKNADAHLQLYERAPRMVPREFNPQMLLSNMAIQEPEESKRKAAGASSCAQMAKQRKVRRRSENNPHQLAVSKDTQNDPTIDRSLLTFYNNSEAIDLTGSPLHPVMENMASPSNQIPAWQGYHKVQEPPVRCQQTDSKQIPGESPDSTGVPCKIDLEGKVHDKPSTINMLTQDIEICQSSEDQERLTEPSNRAYWDAPAENNQIMSWFFDCNAGDHIQDAEQLGSKVAHLEPAGTLKRKRPSQDPPQTMEKRLKLPTGKQSEQRPHSARSRKHRVELLNGTGKVHDDQNLEEQCKKTWLNPSQTPETCQKIEECTNLGPDSSKLLKTKCPDSTGTNRLIDSTVPFASTVCSKMPQDEMRDANFANRVYAKDKSNAENERGCQFIERESTTQQFQYGETGVVHLHEKHDIISSKADKTVNFGCVEEHELAGSWLQHTAYGERRDSTSSEGQKISEIMTQKVPEDHYQEARPIQKTPTNNELNLDSEIKSIKLSRECSQEAPHSELSGSQASPALVWQCKRTRQANQVIWDNTQLQDDQPSGLLVSPINSQDQISLDQHQLEDISPQPHERGKQKHKPIEHFLEVEAEVSQENSASEDEDENLDSHLPGFIDNQTQPALATQITPGMVPDMTSIYHQSVISPVASTPEFVHYMEEKYAKRPADTQHLSAMDDDQSEEPDSVEEESCQLCETGGELLLCDSCNGGFHLSCIGLKDVPKGDWMCTICLAEMGVPLAQ